MDLSPEYLDLTSACSGVQDVKMGEHMEALSKFMFTKTQPRLFYMPANHNDSTTSRLNECKEEHMQKAKAGGLVLEVKEEWEEWVRLVIFGSLLVLRVAHDMTPHTQDLREKARAERRQRAQERG